MKHLILLTLAVILVASCKKKEEPTPSTQDSNNNTTVTFQEKTLQFYRSGDTGSEIVQIYVGEDQSNLPFKSTLEGFKREETTVCQETKEGAKVQITKAGRYYYESRRGLISYGFTMTHAGYIDVSSDGTVTVTQTTNPPGKTVEFDKCNTTCANGCNYDKNLFTINY